MRNSLTHKAIRVFLIYLRILCLASAGANVNGVVFRQYLRVANQLILAAGLIAILMIWNIEISKEQKRKRTTARIITIILTMLSFIGLFLQIFMGIDKETVVLKDGEKKIEVERSWIMFLERSYYDYENIFWYAKYPHYTESYDDGSPYRLVYTDYYNEDGNFTDRIYPDE